MLKGFELKKSKDNKQFDGIISSWKEGTNEEKEQLNEWDYLHYMDAFYKAKEYEICLEIYKECISVYPYLDKLDNEMVWSLYRAKIKTFDFETGDISELLKLIDYALEHCNDSQPLPRWAVIDYITKAVRDGKVGEERDYSLVEKYLLQVNPEVLSKKENQMYSGRPLPSNYESWHSRMSKALLEQKKYAECMECCDKALASIEKFHSNNDVWFRYRKAVSLRGVDRESEGTAIINQALSGRFSHWCLFEYLYDNAVSANDTETAMIYAAKCALADSEHKMRVLFYQKYAEYLEKIGNSKISMLLRHLIIVIRQEEGWREKSYFADWNITDDVKQMSKEELLKELNSFWRSLAESDKTNGRITSIISGGVAGFVEDKNGNSYYFNARDFKSNKSKMIIGEIVKFDLVDGFDKKKNIATKNAINITV